MKIQYFIILIIISSLIGCQSTTSEDATQESDCITGTPVPILSDTMSHISNHSFEVTEQNSVEKATLPNAVEVEFLQSGCENLTQEFRFHLPKGNDYTQQHDTIWVQTAGKNFYKMAGYNADPQADFFKQFGMMLQTYSTVVQFNEPLTLEHLLGPGMHFIMERAGTTEEGLVSVSIFQKQG